jgi:enoyl-CoA hydratase
MAYEALLVDVAGGVARITINRPDRRNALSPAVVAELGAALAAADQDPAVRVVVLTGAGEKAFSAGGDLGGGGLGGSGGGGDDAPEGFVGRHERGRRFASLFTTMAGLGVPIVARVNGHALAGGFGLMLACDFTVAHDEVQVGTPEIDVGLFPMMIMATMARNVPRKRVLEMALLGERVGAREAAAWGIFNRVVPRAELDAAVGEIVGKLLAKSPAVLRLGRRAFYAMSEMPFTAALEYLNAMLTVNTTAEDAMEGIMAFLSKRPPAWKGK